MAEIAEDIWDRYGYDFGTDYSGLFKALSNVNYNVRLAASEALAAILDEYPDTIQVMHQLRTQLIVNFRNLFFLICSGYFRNLFLHYSLCTSMIPALEGVLWMLLGLDVKG